MHHVLAHLFEDWFRPAVTVRWASDHKREDSVSSGVHSCNKRMKVAFIKASSHWASAIPMLIHRYGSLIPHDNENENALSCLKVFLWSLSRSILRSVNVPLGFLYIKQKQKLKIFLDLCCYSMWTTNRKSEEPFWKWYRFHVETNSDWVSHRLTAKLFFKVFILISSTFFFLFAWF